MRIRDLLVALAIAAATGVLAFSFHVLPLPKHIVEPLELETVDWRTRSLPSVTRQSGQVVLVVLDGETVKEWPYLSPFPRGVLADLVDVVSRSGARVIGLDVFLDRRYPALDAMDRGEERLRAAMQRAGNVVLVAGTEEVNGQRRLLSPDPYFASVAAAVATADLPTPYETIRDATLGIQTGRQLIPGFSLALYALSQGIPAEKALHDLRVSSGVVHARSDAHGWSIYSLPLLFTGPPSRVDHDDGAFPVFSGSTMRALGASMPPDWLRGKVVLIGSGFHPEERFRSPFYERMDTTGSIFGWTYGVEVHATALEDLLMRRFMRHPSGLAVLLALLLLASAVSLVVFTRGSVWGTGVAALQVIGVWVGAWIAFGYGYWAFPVVVPTLAVGLSLMASTAVGFLMEGREKRMIRSAFSKYVPPAVVEELAADPARLRLGGERRRVSILFSDIAGFSRIAEGQDPQLLLLLLNEYLSAMTTVLLDEGGTLDKYIGDGVMALFGAPVSLPDHAARACRAALRMQSTLAQLNPGWEARGLPALRMRIGIHTGEPVVGNIGGTQRFDYTALGDDVNLAARLEPAGKTYGVGVVVSEAIRHAAGDGFVMRELEKLQVYGRNEPVRIFELVGTAGEVAPEKHEVLKHFADGLAAYRSRDFVLAREYFTAAATLAPDDGPSRLYLERCEAMIESPPPADWSFVVRSLTK